MKYIFAAFTLFLFNYCNGQKYLKANEEVILSFTTTNQKQVFLVKDTSDLYLVYRFGTKNNIEFEYPEMNKASWTKFNRSNYSRGGGVRNEGMELNYVYFSNKGYRYVLYQTYHAVGEKLEIGIKVINLQSNKTVDIKGDYKTKNGSLFDLIDNTLIKEGDELF